MSGFSNFAISFTIISILSGCLTLYYFGLQHGGPPVMTWGWLLVGTLVMFAGLSMAEICSAYPTAGGLYYWAAKLAPGKSAPIWSWFVGWFNLLGQVAVTAGITMGCAFSCCAFLSMATGNEVYLEAKYTVGIFAILLFTQALLNTFGVRLVALLNDVSVYWHLVGVAIIVDPSLHRAVVRLASDGELPLRQRGLEGVRGPLGLLAPVLHLPRRSAERAVHVHRLRRLRPRLRGDEAGEHPGGEGHRPLHLGLDDRRLHPAGRRELRDPAHVPRHHRGRRVPRLRIHRHGHRAVGDHLRVRRPATTSPCSSS